MALNITQVTIPQSNYQKGRGGKKIEFVVLHWIVGNLAAADASFQNPQRIASATYGIGHTEIHQYVKEEDTPYTNSNFDSNQRSVTIEHEGGQLLSNGTRQTPSEDTHKTSIQLVADICKRNNIPCDRAHVKKHSEISATQCPGSLNIDRIVTEAAKIVNAPVTPPTPPSDDLYRVTHKGTQLGAFAKNPIDRIDELEKRMVQINALSK